MASAPAHQNGHGQRLVVDGGAQIAQTQALFREVNEQLRHLSTRFSLDRTLDFLCECGSRACSESVELTLAEYEAVRRMPTHFVVKPTHELPDVERVVEETDRFSVVEKFGEAGIIAVRFDPRRRARRGADPPPS